MKGLSAVFACLFAIAGCEGMPEDTELEGEPEVDDPAEPDDIDSVQQEHRNHWSYGARPGVRIGVGTFSSTCADENLDDLSLDLEPTWQRGTRNYTTFDGRIVSRYGGRRTTYAAVTKDTPDWYDPAQSAVKMSTRVEELVRSESYWGSSGFVLANVGGLIGGRYFNTAATSHYRSRCKNAFITKFYHNDFYPRAVYSFSVQPYHNIKTARACQSRDLAAEPWAALDVYVKECRNGTCETRQTSSNLTVPGVWVSNTCRVWTTGFYQPRAGWIPKYFNLVASAGIGHVPSAAKIGITRVY